MSKGRTRKQRVQSLHDSCKKALQLTAALDYLHPSESALAAPWDKVRTQWRGLRTYWPLKPGALDELTKIGFQEIEVEIQKRLSDLAGSCTELAHAATRRAEQNGGPSYGQAWSRLVDVWETLATSFTHATDVTNVEKVSSRVEAAFEAVANVTPALALDPVLWPIYARHVEPTAEGGRPLFGHLIRAGESWWKPFPGEARAGFEAELEELPAGTASGELKRELLALAFHEDPEYLDEEPPPGIEEPREFFRHWLVTRLGRVAERSLKRTRRERQQEPEKQAWENVPPSQLPRVEEDPGENRAENSPAEEQWAALVVAARENHQRALEAATPRQREVLEVLVDHLHQEDSPTVTGAKKRAAAELDISVNAIDVTLSRLRERL